MSITEELQSTLHYGKEVVVAAARGGLNALPEKGLRLQAEPRALAIGAGLGAALGVSCVALTERRKSPLALLAGGLIGGLLATSVVLAWEHRSVAEDMVRGGINGSRPVRDKHWLENHPIDYA